MRSNTRSRTLRAQGLRRSVIAATGVAVLAVATACSSSGGGTPAGGSGGGATTTGGSGSGGSDSGGMALAQAAYKKYSAVPTAQDVAPPQKLNGKVPSGKTIVFLETAGVSTNVTMAKEMSTAATLLGWKVRVLPQDGSLAGTQKAFDQAIALKPDGIAVLAVAPSQLTKQLSEAKAAKIPVAFASVVYDQPYEFPMVGNMGGTPLLLNIAEALAAAIVVDSGGKANVLDATIPAFAILKPYVEAIDKNLKSYCATCTFGTINGNVTDIGTGFPTKVVTAIQTKPKTNYVLFDVADFSRGVQTALRTAGLSSKVKIGGSSPNSASIQAIKDGTDFGWAGTEPTYFGWRFVDMFARYYTGTPAPIEADAPVPVRIIDKTNLEDALNPNNDAALGTPVSLVSDAYKAIWGL